MITQKTVMISAHNRSRAYYESKGYQVPHKVGELFEVKVKDLLPSSSQIVKCTCDYCGDTEVYRHYGDICKNKKVTCTRKECIQAAREETMLKRYGARTGAQCPEIRKKMGDTREKNTGYRTPFCNPKDRSNFENKRLDAIYTFLYSNKNPWKDPSKRESIAIKTAKTKYENNTAPISPQQLYLSKLFHGEINYNIQQYNVDIAILNEKIVIEYDGLGHDLSYTLGRITKQEFMNYELSREQVIFNYGYKLIRFISPHDYLPQSDVLLQLFEYGKNALKENRKILIDLEQELIFINDKVILFDEVLL